jgi:tetratricopeptide (TPR) repeat protein
LALAVISAFGASSTLAAPGDEPPEQKRATELFEQGRKLMDEGRFAEACALLAQSYELARGVGIQFNLASCLEAQGKVASARRHFSEAADIAERAGQPDRAEVARGRAEALKPRVSTVVLRVRDQVPGLQLDCDGRALAREQWGVPVELDPGDHELRASAPGHRSWRQLVRLPGEAQRVALDLPALEPASARAGDGAGRSTPLTDEPVADDSAQLTTGLVIGGLGLVAIGVGAAFGVSAMSKQGDSDAYCDATGCDPEGLALIDEAQQAGNASTGLFIAGAALLGGGIVIAATAPTDSDRQPASEAALRLAVGPGALAASASWQF